MSAHAKPRPLEITRCVSKADATYFDIPFEVPASATRFDLSYRYPHSDNCVIDLGLGDPDLTDFPSKRGLVGWSGGARGDVFVSLDEASPGYRPGLRPGTWHVLLGLHMLPDEPVVVVIEISFDTTPREMVRKAEPRQIRHAPRGWYRGDLQCHTFHSDAKGSPEMLHDTAVREGLDFLAVTDHNTTTAQEAYFDGASSPELVFVPAYEFTTKRGHGNVFGAREVEDFRVSTDQDVIDMVARIRAKGHVFSINHDKPDIPWTYALPEIDCMEVWQAPWLAANFLSLEKYQARLAAGQRLTAIGGSDFHQPEAPPSDNIGTLARPTTYLMCEELSVAGILDALRAGRSFVTEAPDGPRLILDVQGVGHGSEIEGGEVVELSYDARDAMGDVLEIWDATGCVAMAGLCSSDEAGLLRLPMVRGFLRGQIVAKASRAGLVAEARRHLAKYGGGRLEWLQAMDQPVLRSLTSPIYVTGQSD